jgi:glycosyltransferase involved in cell wall biosynthesis
MRCSVIICTRNRGASLDQTLDAFRSMVVPKGLKTEVLIVNNGSSDATDKIAAKHSSDEIPVRHIFEPEPGLARARNSGLRESAGEIIVFTDDDVRPSGNWLEEMVRPIFHRQWDAVVGRIDLAANLSRPWMTNTHRHWLASAGSEPAEKLELIGASMGFHRCVLDRVPGFDIELGAGALGFGEDTLFSWQLQEAGFRIGYAPGAAVVHHPDEDRLARTNWLSAARKMGRSYAYIGYHWQHKAPSRPYIRFCRALAQYYCCRGIKHRDCAASEGIALWELVLLERMHRLRHYIALRNCSRKYEKNGFRKCLG